MTDLNSLSDRECSVPLRVSLSTPEGAQIATLDLRVPLDGLSDERIALAVEQAVPGAHRARVVETGPEQAERHSVIVTDAAGAVIALGAMN